MMGSARERYSPVQPKDVERVETTRR